MQESSEKIILTQFEKPSLYSFSNLFPKDITKSIIIIIIFSMF